MKPAKCPAREKNEARKAKKKKIGEERKQKVKVKTAVSLLLSAHARTSQADILHLDPKAVKCTTCKPVCGKF